MFSAAAISISLLAMSPGVMRRKSNRWQRDRMVAGTLWISVVARMKSTWDGGSSSVFSRALNAPVDSICTSSMMYTRFLTEDGA